MLLKLLAISFVIAEKTFVTRSQSRDVQREYNVSIAGPQEPEVV